MHRVRTGRPAVRPHTHCHPLSADVGCDFVQSLTIRASVTKRASWPAPTGAAVAGENQLAARNVDRFRSREVGLGASRARSIFEAGRSGSDWRTGKRGPQGHFDRPRTASAREIRPFFRASLHRNLDRCRFLSQNTVELIVLPVLGGFYRPNASYCDSPRFRRPSGK